MNPKARCTECYPRRWLAALLTVVALLAQSCTDRMPTAGGQDAVPVRITVFAAGTPISTLVVEVTASDFATPLVFNLTVAMGVASGTLRIPPGVARTIRVTAFDDAGSVTHEGSVTVDVRPGQNPPVNLALTPRAGQVPIVVTFGNFSVVVTPAEATIDAGIANQVQLTVSVTGADGQPVAEPQVSWATTHPTLAAVSTSGLVTGLGNGAVTIVATFEGVAGLSAISVKGVGAQLVTVTTLAGDGTPGFVDGAAPDARFSSPEGVAVAPDGALYVADRSNGRIRRVDPVTAAVSTLAGDGTAGFADGDGGAAQFNGLLGVAVAPDGTLYVADANNHCIRRIDPVTGAVSTLAGDGTAGFADGVGTSARFNFPVGVTVALDGTLYVADAANHRIRRIDPATAAVSTLAGNGAAGFHDEVGAFARFAAPSGVTVALDGTLYVADAGNHSIRRIDPVTAAVSTLAGDGTAGFVDGVGTTARFNRPVGVAVASDGVLYVTDVINNAIRRIDPGSAVVGTVAGDGTPGFVDGVGTTARFRGPFGVAAASDGGLYVADTDNHSIRRIRFD